MAVINGINKDTIKNMQLDAGVILNGEIATPDSADIQSEITKSNVGATKGATTFSAIPEIRNIFDGIDGVRGDIKDGNVIDKWEVTLKTSVSEFTLKNLQLSLGASTNSTGSKFYTIEPKDEIVTGDYKTITWIGTMAGSEDPIIITLRNCLNINGLTITAEDKNTGTVEIELRAHINLNNDREKQFTIYLPKNQRVLAASEVAEIKEKFEIESEE